MKETFNFKDIELNEDMRDVAKRDLETRLDESIQLPKLRGTYTKGYTKPFENNPYLTESKDNFSFRDSFLESLDLNDGGKSTYTRLKEAEETSNRIRKTIKRMRPVDSEEEVSNGLSMQDALDAYLAKEKKSLKEARRPLNPKEPVVEEKHLSMQDALDAYLAKKKGTLKEARRPFNHREEIREEKHLSMQDALDAYLAKERETLKEAKRPLNPQEPVVEEKHLSMQDALDAYLAKERETLKEARRPYPHRNPSEPKRNTQKKVSTPEEMKNFLDNLLKRSQELYESTVHSRMNDLLFFVVKTPSGKFLCEEGAVSECSSLEDAEAYDTFEDAESAIRSYADKAYDGEVGEFEIRGIESTDFRDVGAMHTGKRLDERSNPIKELTVDFPVSVTDRGHVRASDAKRLLKYLYSTKQLRAGTQYFIKDVNGVETNWDFARCVYKTGYQYEFSCEVADDDMDVYQALYISKDYKGRLDWSDTEWVREKVK